MPVLESPEKKEKLRSWPLAVQARLEELEGELKDEEITKKGFWNKKYSLVEEYLSKEQISRVVELRAETKQGSLTDLEYFNKMDELLVPEKEFVDKTVKEEKPDLFKEDDKENVQNGQVKPKEESSSSSSSSTQDSTSGPSASGSSSSTQESSSKPSPTKSPETKRPRKAAPVKGQLSLMDSFKNAAAKKRKSEPDGKNQSDAKKLKETKVDRCPTCRQNNDDPDVIRYETHPDGAKPEFEAIFDERVMLESDEGYDSLPQYKLTGFTVYCKEGHVVRFDTNLIEKNKLIYFSGFVKPVFSEDSSIEGGVAVKDAGPITSWWNAGFDGGDNPLTGFTTLEAEYYLMQPSELYKPVMRIVEEKVTQSALPLSFTICCIYKSFPRFS